MNRKDKISGGIIGMIAGDILAFPFRSINYDHRKEIIPISPIVEIVIVSNAAILSKVEGPFINLYNDINTDNSIIITEIFKI